MIFTWSSRISPSSRMEILLWALRRLKNTFFWLAVVPIFTSDHARSLDRRLDPPHGVGGEPEALLRLEALDRLHQADIALGDRFGDRQAVIAVSPGDLGHEPQMAGDELVRRVAIAVLAPALG